MKKIVLMPVKNEGWILNLSLQCASTWADIIIILDQNSDDNTAAIYQKFAKVVAVKNISREFNEGERRKILLQEARKFTGDNLLFHLDADEIISSEILTEENNKILENLAPGTAIKIPIFNLWGDFKYYNQRYPWGGNYIDIAYKDDRKLQFEDGFIHLARIPQSLKEKSQALENFCLLHLQYLDLPRSAAKQRFYRILEFINSDKKISSALKLNFKYFFTKEKPKLQVLRESYLATYQDLGIDFKIEPKLENYFYQEEYALKEIISRGENFFKWLDIWDVDWQTLGINKYKLTPSLKDPRHLFIRIYHHQIQKLISQTFQMLRALILKNALTYRFYKKFKKNH